MTTIASLEQHWPQIRPLPEASVAPGWLWWSYFASPSSPRTATARGPSGRSHTGALELHPGLCDHTECEENLDVQKIEGSDSFKDYFHILHFIGTYQVSTDFRLSDFFLFCNRSFLINRVKMKFHFRLQFYFLYNSLEVYYNSPWL